MEKPSSQLQNKSPGRVGWKLVVWIATVAYIAGAATVWLVLREMRPAALTQPPSFATQKAPAPMPEGASTQPSPDVLQLSPTQSAITLGNWNYDNKNWPQAIANYQHAISLGLDNADIRTDLGNAYRYSGNPQKALEQYRSARAENPQHENSLFNMATLYAQVLNDPADAAQACQEYLRRFPVGDKSALVKKLLDDMNLTPLKDMSTSGTALP